MIDICKVCLKTVKRSEWQFSVITVTIGFVSNVIVLINLTMKCLKVQRTRDSVYSNLQLSAIDMKKPKKQLPHQQIFYTIINFFI